MATLSIHHATAKKAERLGVTLVIEDDRILAWDTDAPDHEFSGTNAAQLLEQVLSQRPQDAKSANGADEDADEVEDADDADEVEAADDADDEADEDEGEDADEAGEGGGSDDDGEVEGDEDEATEAGTIVKSKYKLMYAPFDDTCGDAFAEALSLAGRNADGGLDIEASASIAAQNGLSNKWFGWMAHLNPGQCRMCLGNMLRGKVRRGEEVVIGNEKFVPVRDEEGNLVKGEYVKNVSRGAMR